MWAEWEGEKLVGIEWVLYVADEPADYIPVSEWSKDHWSTLVYLETVAVDNGGIVDNRRMRCNPRLHRELANLSFGRHGGPLIDGSKYPTRLRDGKTVDKHDDWSCLEDMVAAELVQAWLREERIGEVFGGSQAKVELTNQGHELVAQLRKHKAGGGNYATFEPCLGSTSHEGVQ